MHVLRLAAANRRLLQDQLISYRATARAEVPSLSSALAASLGQRNAAAGAPAEAPVLRDFDPFFRTATDGGPITVTSLNLSLLGTRVDTVSGRGSAIIDAGGVQTSFLVGEAVMPGVTLEAVDFDNVTIARGGVREKLYLDQSAAPGAAPAAADATTIAPDLMGGNVSVPPPPPLEVAPTPVPAQ